MLGWEKTLCLLWQMKEYTSVCENLNTTRSPLACCRRHRVGRIEYLPQSSTACAACGKATSLWPLLLTHGKITVRVIGVARAYVWAHAYTVEQVVKPPTHHHHRGRVIQLPCASAASIKIEETFQKVSILLLFNICTSIP